MASSTTEMSQHDNDNGDATKQVQIAGDDSVKKEEEEEQHTKCFTWMVHHRLGWLARLPGKWPRTFALILGVIFPLFLLIAVSLFFGYGLAKLEEAYEIEANNDIIANRALIDTATQFHGNITKQLPRICLGILASENATDIIFQAMEEKLDEIFVQVVDRKNATEDTILEEIDQDMLPNSTSEVLEFMENCGALGFDMANRFARFGIQQEFVGSDLTFNWIRCDGLGRNETTSLGEQIWGRPHADPTSLRPNVQAADAVASWRRNASALYDEELARILAQNGTSPVNARIQAYGYSVENADGFKHCYPNSAAGAWFWFTVMTTIGYGNTAPVTEGGRAMIYTLGFFSILLFAIILGSAGTIVVTLWGDFIDRTKLHQLNIPWVACIFWGCCYYAWMLVIAAVTQNWKAARLGEDMEFSEAYWFSYISTTTVGLGDYHLEHDVILRRDLFTFPLMFLTGFVLLANFFVKLTELISNLIPRHRPTLEERLAKSDTPCLPKMPKARLKEISLRQKARFMAYTSHAFTGTTNAFSRRSSPHDDDEDEISMASDNYGIDTGVVEDTGSSEVEDGEAPLTDSVPVEAGDGSVDKATGTATMESAVA